MHELSQSSALKTSFPFRGHQLNRIYWLLGSMKLARWELLKCWLRLLTNEPAHDEWAYNPSDLVGTNAM